MNDLKSYLEQALYWESKIIEYNFDMLKNEINFRISFPHKENDTIRRIEYNLNFKKVSSYFFIKDVGDDRFYAVNDYEYEETDYLELSSIGYYENGIGNFFIESKKEWAKQYNANANFALEIWSGMLFIEAGIFEINDKVYHLKKLNNSNKDVLEN